MLTWSPKEWNLLNPKLSLCHILPWWAQKEDHFAILKSPWDCVWTDILSSGCTSLSLRLVSKPTDADPSFGSSKRLVSVTSNYTPSPRPLSEILHQHFYLSSLVIHYTPRVSSSSNLCIFSIFRDFFKEHCLYVCILSFFYYP